MHGQQNITFFIMVLQRTAVLQLRRSKDRVTILQGRSARTSPYRIWTGGIL